MNKAMECQCHRSRTPLSASLSRYFLILLIPFWLSACGGGGGADSNAPSTSAPTTFTDGNDTTAPTVTITIPSSGATLTTASATLSGTASDDVSVTRVSWTSDRGGSGSQNFSAATVNWSFSGVPLQSGGNTFTVTARDAVGNVHSAQVSVTYSGTETNFATLSWGANAESDLSGYNVYYGTASGSYLQSRGRGVDVGNTTTYTITGLNRGVRYYFVVTAYDYAGNESVYSDEVFKDIP